MRLMKHVHCTNEKLKISKLFKINPKILNNALTNQSNCKKSGDVIQLEPSMRIILIHCGAPSACPARYEKRPFLS